MTNFGVDLLVEQALRSVEAQASLIAKYWPHSPGAGDTPIEQLFHLALFFRIKFGEQEWFETLASVEKFDPWEASSYGGWEKCIFMERQVQLQNWRVDFVLHHYATWGRIECDNPEGWRRLIVECDGHDFHERTKEQAARDRGRDRAGQLAGMEVFRFTGSELWRDPWGCAEQVMQWAHRGV